MATKAKTGTTASKRSNAKTAEAAGKAAAAPKAAAKDMTAPAAPPPMDLPETAKAATAAVAEKKPASGAAAPGANTDEAREAAATIAAEVEATAKEAATATVEKVEQAVGLMTRQADEAVAAAGRGLDDAAKAGETTVGTLLASGSSLARGFEQMNTSLLSYAQSTFSANLATAQEMMACASVREAMDIQLRHMQASLEGLLAESSKVSGIASSTLSEAWAPLNRQLKAGLERAWTPLAA